MQKPAVLAGFGLVVFASMLFAQNASPNGKKASPAQVKRGEYLVEKIGMCNDCHTPMNERGEPVMEKHLQGSPLMFKPTVPVPGWAERSANIAGLKGWSDEEAIKFFTTGIDPNGKHPGAPMPAYRYSREDAAAVAAYLKSLAPAGNSAAQK